MLSSGLSGCIGANCAVEGAGNLLMQAFSLAYSGIEPNIFLSPQLLLLLYPENINEQQDTIRFHIKTTSTQNINWDANPIQLYEPYL